MDVVFETSHVESSTMYDHRHVSAFVTIVLGGGYVEVRDSAPEFCRVGSIVIHRDGERHADRFAAPTKCLNVELADGTGLHSSCGVLTPDTTDLRDAIRGVVRAFYRERGSLSPAVARLRRMLLDRANRPQLERPPWLGPVLQGFGWESTQPLRDAAEMAGVHETHFSRAFRRHTGMTANEYRARARMRAASTMLLTTTGSLARIAVSAGFSDQSHLTRAFTQRLGLAPARYREAFTR